VNEQRRIIFHKHYFFEFYRELPINVREKITYILNIISTFQNVPKKFFQYMGNGLYEIRIEFESNIYRIFCCFDKGNLVILFNGFQKKIQKTPNKEIDLALKLKKEYFDLKIKENEKGNK
jgi:phage-related protein